MRIEEIASGIVNKTISGIKEKARRDVVNADVAYWASGELAVAYREQYPDEPVSACNMAAGLLYSCAEATIRDRVRVFLAVSEDMRAEISMPASYWREACTGTGGDTDKLLENVGQIMEHRDAYNQMPSIDTVRGWSSKHNHLLVWKSRLISLITTAEKIVFDEQTPKKIAGFLRGVIIYLQGE